MTIGIGGCKRTVRVPCTACVDGYFIPWHARDGSLFYKCCLCETPLDLPTHRERKTRIIAAIDGGCDVAFFVVDESLLRAKRPRWKRRPKRAPVALRP